MSNTPAHIATPSPPALDVDDTRCAALVHLKVPVWVFDVDYRRILWANDAALTLWRADSLAALRERDLSDMSGSVRRRLEQFRADCAHETRSFSELWTFYPDGVPVTVELVISPFPLNDERMGLLVHALHENREGDSNTLRSIQALMHTTSMISLYDKSWNRTYCNPAARDALTADDHRLDEQLVDRRDLDTIVRQLDRDGECDIELQVRTASGVRWHSLNLRGSHDPVTGEPCTLVSAVDVTERFRAQAQADRLAYSDALTGLPNRTTLMHDVERRIGGDSDAFTLCFLDLDRFKLVNDSLGHGVGDGVLVAVADRLRQLAGEEALIARLGGDEFVIVVDATDAPSSEALARRVLAGMAVPLAIGDHLLHVLPSIGLCRYPEHGATFADLLRHADMAMYAAKGDQAGYAVFDVAMNRDIRERLEIENDLVRAVRHDEFENFYQPRIDTKSGAVVGFEALIRWRHGTRGLLPPMTFIGIAEDTGAIVEIGNRVMLGAMRQQRAWQEAGYAVCVSINISARQFTAQDLSATVAAYLDEVGCDPTMIELEITESVLLGDVDTVVETLHRISALGPRIAIDDFGTGYSNLAYLRRFPLHCLKIDRSFVADPEHRPLLELIIGMGEVLGLTLVAEGVETEEQASWLRARHCTEVQGYLYSRPLEAHAASAYLAERRRPAERTIDSAAG